MWGPGVFGNLAHVSPYRALFLGVLFLVLGLALSLLLRPAPPSLADRLRAGGEVRLPPGTYRLEGALELGRGLRLLGAGRGRTRLVLAPGAYLQTPIGAGAVALLQGLTLEREGEEREAPPLLVVPAASRLELAEALLRGNLGGGLLFVRGEARVRGSLLEGGPMGVPTVVALAEGGLAVLEEVTLRYGIHSALAIASGARAELKGGQVGPTGHNGVLVQAGGSLLAEGVRFLGNPNAAVAILGKAEVVLRHNRAEGGRYALVLGPGAQPLLEGNQWQTRAVVARVE